MKNQWGVQLKITLSILLVSAMIFGVVFGYNYISMCNVLMASAAENARNTTIAAAEQITAILSKVEAVPRNVAIDMETQDDVTRDELLALLVRSVQSTPDLFGSAIAFEPFSFISTQRLFAPYMYRDENQDIAISYIDDDAYNYPTLHWYTHPIKEGRPVWSEPYFDEGGGNIIMSTFSVPFYRNDNAGTSIWGVVTADVSLKVLNEIIKSAQVFKEGYAFLISGEGKIITHPNKNIIMTENILDIADKQHSQSLPAIAQDMMNGGEAFVSTIDFSTGEESWMYYAPLESTGWSLGVIFPADVLFHDMNILTQHLAGMALGGFFVLCIVIAILARAMTKRLRVLAQTTEDIAMGNLTVSLPDSKVSDEIGILWRSVSRMTTGLASLVGKIKTSSVGLTASASEIAATSREQEHVVQDFKASSQQVVAAVKEISATSRELSRTMQNVKATAIQTEQVADSGHTGLQDMSSKIQQLSTATRSIAGKLHDIEEKAQGINLVITTITKVADQTNLLSLNAAIEAEQAGEYGAGFSIVAQEVRRLADQTAVATLDIEHMVKAMQSSVNDGVREMKFFDRSVQDMLGAITTISNQFACIIERVKDLTPQFEMVSDGMSAQSEGADQISSAVEQLNQGARQTAESLSQFNAATTDLRNAATLLQKEIAHFKLTCE